MHALFIFQGTVCNAGGGARDNFVTESKVFGNVSFIDRERLSVPEKSGEKFQKSFAKFGLR